MNQQYQPPAQYISVYYSASFLIHPTVMYGPQIAWWLEYFTPDNLLIINSQRLKDHAAQVIREI